MQDNSLESQVQELQETYERVEELKDSLSHRFDEVSSRYLKAAYPPKGYGVPSDGTYIEWNIEGGYVECKWEETWSYGGHDEGTFSFPVEYLHNEQSLLDFEEEKSKEKEKKKKEFEERERKSDLKKLAELQKKLGK